MRLADLIWRVLVLMLASLALPLRAQEAAKPLTRQQLLAILDVLKGDAADPVIPEIQRQGVNFEMTAADEEELHAAGASANLLAAIAKSYRQPGPAPVTGGPPLGKDELMLLLQNGVAVDRLEALVAARGVSFVATPEVVQQFAQAGAGERLILLVKVRAIPAANAVTQPPPTAAVLPQASGNPSVLAAPAGPAQQTPPQQQSDTQPVTPSTGCIAVKPIGSHALRNIMLGGIAGALISKQQYQVVNSLSYPVRIGQKFHGNDLQTIQASGTKVVILDKHYTGEDLRKSCQ